MATALGWFVREIGLSTLWNSSRDVKLLCLQRFVRIFAFGACSLILATLLLKLGFRDELVGLFMSLTLLGDVLISFVLTIFADALGRKNILVVGSALMAISGIVFATMSNFWVLLIAAVFGVIAPTGAEIGPFRAIEESILAQLAGKERRSDLFTWYTLIGVLGAAMGQIIFGWIIDRLTHSGWTDVEAYRVTFMAYAALGLVKLGLALCLSHAAEREKKPDPLTEAADRDTTNADDPTRPLLADANPPVQETDADEIEQQRGDVHSAEDQSQKRKQPSRLRSLLPSISAESRSILVRLCLLFSVDSFATGLVTVSWTAVFFIDKFRLEAGALGTLFFVTSIVAAFSNLISASLARRIGLVRTMVFTHLPSSVFLALIPVPDSQWLAMAFMTLRACTMTMDTAPRQAFLAAAVLDSERTAVMGFVNVVRTLSQSAGPLTTGALRAAGKFWVAFVLAGSLKSAYDLGMLAIFLGFKERA